MATTVLDFARSEGARQLVLGATRWSRRRDGTTWQVEATAGKTRLSSPDQASAPSAPASRNRPA